RPHSPCHRPEGALRQLRLHDAYSSALEARERRSAADALRTLRQSAIPVPLPVGEELRGVLGQSLRSALCHVGLLSPGAIRIPRDDQGRAPGLKEKQLAGKGRSREEVEARLARSPYHRWIGLRIGE